MNFIADFLRGIMDFLYTYMSGGHYAIAIILFTLIIKLVILPLDINQRKSMRRMSEVQPKVNAINEKYKNDPEKRNIKTQELYKAERVSPLGGCLPLLIQLPILFAMFAVIRNIANEQTVKMFLDVQNGVDFTQPGFLSPFFWVSNLWQPDSFTAAGTIIPVGKSLAQIKAVAGNVILTDANITNLTQNYMQVMQGAIEFFNGTKMNGWGILPVLVFGTQFLTQKLMPKQAPNPNDKNSNMMKTMNTFMPVIFLFICWGYSAAFSLYFAISNLYGLVQNLALNYYFDQKSKKSNEVKPT